MTEKQLKAEWRSLVYWFGGLGNSTWRAKRLGKTGPEAAEMEKLRHEIDIFIWAKRSEVRKYYAKSLGDIACSKIESGK